jgi:hypothetical protein
MRVLPAFPSGVRGLRDFQRGLLGVRGALSQALHAACDAHLVPTLRALHYRVPCAFVSAHAPRLVVRVCCVVLRGTHHTLPTRGFFFTDVDIQLATAETALSFHHYIPNLTNTNQTRLEINPPPASPIDPVVWAQPHISPYIQVHTEAERIPVIYNQNNNRRLA